MAWTSYHWESNETLYASQMNALQDQVVDNATALNQKLDLIFINDANNQEINAKNEIIAAKALGQTVVNNYQTQLLTFAESDNIANEYYSTKTVVDALSTLAADVTQLLTNSGQQTSNTPMYESVYVNTGGAGVVLAAQSLKANNTTYTPSSFAAASHTHSISDITDAPALSIASNSTTGNFLSSISVSGHTITPSYSTALTAISAVAASGSSGNVITGLTASGGTITYTQGTAIVGLSNTGATANKYITGLTTSSNAITVTKEYAYNNLVVNDTANHDGNVIATITASNNTITATKTKIDFSGYTPATGAPASYFSGITTIEAALNKIATDLLER